jgi:hypothetical protein
MPVERVPGRGATVAKAPAYGQRGGHVVRPSRTRAPRSARWCLDDPARGGRR